MRRVVASRRLVHEGGLGGGGGGVQIEAVKVRPLWDLDHCCLGQRAIKADRALRLWSPLARSYGCSGSIIRIGCTTSRPASVFS